jgi:hypothetical protein
MRKTAAPFDQAAYDAGRADALALKPFMMPSGGLGSIG